MIGCPVSAPSFALRQTSAPRLFCYALPMPQPQPDAPIGAPSAPLHNRDPRSVARPGIPSNAAANLLLAAAAKVVAALPFGCRSDPPRHVLVVRLGNVGDIVVAIPAFRAMRALYPEARLTLLTSPTRRGAPGAREVLANDSIFDGMIVYYEDESGHPSFLGTLRRRLRDSAVDLAVVLPNHMTPFASVAKYLALFAASGVRRTAGCRLVRPLDYQRPQVDRLVEIVSTLGAVAVPPFPWLTVSGADARAAEDMITPANAPVMIGMHVGAQRPSNRWPVERFIALGKLLTANPGRAIVLTGGAGEAGLTAAVARELGERCVDLAGRTTLGQLAAVAARCRVFVSNDTGAMHMAYAVGTPVVVPFGGRFFPHVWYPYGEGHAVLRKQIECSPCFSETCPLYAEPACLARIDATEAAQAVEAILARRGESPLEGGPGNLSGRA